MSDRHAVLDNDHHVTVANRRGDFSLLRFQRAAEVRLQEDFRQATWMVAEGATGRISPLFSDAGDTWYAYWEGATFSGACPAAVLEDIHAVHGRGARAAELAGDLRDLVMNVHGGNVAGGSHVEGWEEGATLPCGARRATLALRDGKKVRLTVEEVTNDG